MYFSAVDSFYVCDEEEYEYEYAAEAKDGDGNVDASLEEQNRKLSTKKKKKKKKGWYDPSLGAADMLLARHLLKRTTRRADSGDFDLAFLEVHAPIARLKKPPIGTSNSSGGGGGGLWCEDQLNPFMLGGFIVEVWRHEQGSSGPLLGALKAAVVELCRTTFGDVDEEVASAQRDESSAAAKKEEGDENDKEEEEEKKEKKEELSHCAGQFGALKDGQTDDGTRASLRMEPNPLSIPVLPELFGRPPEERGEAGVDGDRSHPHWHTRPVFHIGHRDLNGGKHRRSPSNDCRGAGWGYWNRPRAQSAVGDRWNPAVDSTGTDQPTTAGVRGWSAHLK